MWFCRLGKRLLALPLLFVSLFPISAAQPNRIPVQAELVHDLDAGHIKVGDVVFATVAVPWQDSACALRRGALLKGRVVAGSAYAKSARASQIALLFESGQCGGRDLRPLALTVAAVVAATNSLLADQYENPPLADAVGLGIEGGMRSVTSAAATNWQSPSRAKPAKAVMPGQVVGIPNVKLQVGGGPEGSSVLTATGRNLHLDSGSQLVLVSKAAEVIAAATPAPNVAPPTSTASSPVPATPEATGVDESEICAPPECSIALSEAGPAARATATIDIKRLGFPAPASAEMAGFDYDAAIAYLGPKQLLFTFNPHVLVRRTGPVSGVRNLRLVRAVLLDLETMKARRTVEWQVLDAGQYLWPVGPDKVLVHTGRELRLYGPGLGLEQKLSLEGMLAFVRPSPSGRYFAVGVIQERHSDAVHRQLAETEGREPEEDVQVRVLDANFRPLATVQRSSRDVPPVLLDEGEVRLPAIGKNRWRIVEYTWDKQRRVLGQVSSTCMPVATSLPSNSLFVVGCDRQADGKWYRVLRPDGKPVLKGWSPSVELEQTANGSAASGAFAVGIAQAINPLAEDAIFRASDLVGEHIGVYRTENGRQLFAVSVSSPVPTVQTFVLSPAGDQLAVLSRGQIALYPVTRAR